MNYSNMFNFVLQQLDAAGKARWPLIAQESGVPFDTLLKIGKRITTNPRISTVQALADHFAGNHCAMR